MPSNTALVLSLLVTPLLLAGAVFALARLKKFSFFSGYHYANVSVILVSIGGYLICDKLLGLDTFETASVILKLCVVTYGVIFGAISYAASQSTQEKNSTGRSVEES